MPYSLARIAKQVPAPIMQASKDAELAARLGDGPVAAALRQVSVANISGWEGRSIKRHYKAAERVNRREIYLGNIDEVLNSVCVQKPRTQF